MQSAFLSCSRQSDWLSLAGSIVQKVVRTVQHCCQAPGRGLIQLNSRHHDWPGIGLVFSSDCSTSNLVWYFRIGLFYEESAPMMASSAQLISKLARHTWQKKGTIVRVGPDKCGKHVLCMRSAAHHARAFTTLILHEACPKDLRSTWERGKGPGYRRNAIDGLGRTGRGRITNITQPHKLHCDTDNHTVRVSTRHRSIATRQSPAPSAHWSLRNCPTCLKRSVDRADLR